jgi:hypothetical protein
MLSKLLKHELKATARYLSPLYLILLLLSVVNRIILELDIFDGFLIIIPRFITFFYVLSIIAVIVVSFLMMIIRFYKNLMTDEGYLMFTLPVKSNQLINSKLLVSMFWTVASIVAVIASILIVGATPESLSSFMDGLRAFWADVNAELNGKALMMLLEIIVMALLGLINSILMIYVSIAIGQLFNGHKLIGAFGAYIAIYVALQIGLTLLVFLISIISKDAFMESTSVPDIVFPLVLFVLIILNATYYLVTNYIFKKKLNLE